MAFFKKLKDRLFKSSSKIDEGLDAIVEDGGEEEIDDARQANAQQTPTVEDAILEPPPEPAPEVVAPAEPDEPVQVDYEEIDDARQAIAEQTPRGPEPEPKPVPTPEPEPKPVPTPEPEPKPVPTPEPTPIPVETVAEPTREPAKPGLLNRLFNRPEQKSVLRRTLDDDMLEQIEELLISTDMGVETSMRVAANMAEGRLGKKFSTDELKDVMATEIARIMEPVAKPMPIYQKRPQVVLVVGVNGSGKTTTIGKLASQFRASGKTVVIAAGDTFRAAAVEQLQIWGDRAGVPVMTAPEGSDPASLAFDAMTKAEADGADLLMIDTAGRLQNRQDLMEELAKIVRVIRKKDPDAPHNTLLVLDATTGQNALNQVEIFQKIADVSGLVMTKLDGTAKGGVLVALADRFGLPIHAIGVGEQIDDLAPFDPREFAAALTGLEE